MSFSKIIKRELEVAFSKHTQPVWLRILKYVVLAGLVWLLWDSDFLWIILSALFIFAFALHFWYRCKTAGWTKSYGGWDYEKNKPK